MLSTPPRGQPRFKTARAVAALVMGLGFFVAEDARGTLVLVSVVNPTMAVNTNARYR